MFEALKNSEGSVSPSQLDKVEDCFKTHENLSVGLESRHHQLEYLKKSLHLSVSMCCKAVYRSYMNNACSEGTVNLRIK